MNIKRRKIIAIFLFVFPVPLLIISLSAYAIFTFIIESIITSGGEVGTTIVMMQAVNIVLQILGIISILGLFIGIPVGIWMYISARKQEKDLLPTPKN